MDKGIELYNNGQYDGAFKKLVLYLKKKKENDSDYHDAHNMIDRILLRHPLSEDNLAWFERICQRPNYELDIIQSKLYIKEKDFYKAITCLDKAKSKGYALYLIGKFYEKGLGVTKDDSKALQYYEEASIKGDTTAQCRLGHYYEEKKEYQLAVKYYTLSSNKGNSDAQYRVGYMYEKGIGIEQDIPKAISLYRKSIQRGNKLAKKRQWVILKHSGKTTAQLKWMESNVVEDDGEMMCELGDLHRSTDMGKAIYWYERCVEIGYVDALYRLYNLTDDRKKKMRYLKQAISLGDINAIYILGQDILEDNKLEGMRLIRSASKKGHGKASFFLARSFLDKDFERSGNYLDLALKQGIEDIALDDVLFILGEQFLDSDVKRASRYFRLIQNHEGDLRLYSYLGEIYEHGIGVKKDLMLAKYYRCLYRWHNGIGDTVETICDTPVFYDIYLIEGLDQIKDHLLRNTYRSIKRHIEDDIELHLNTWNESLSELITQILKHNQKAIPEIVSALNETSLHMRDLHQVIVSYYCGFTIQDDI